MKNISFYLAIICSVLSQILIALEMGYSDVLKLSWVIPFSLFIVSDGKKFLSKAVVPYYLFVFIFVFYCAFCEAITGKNYIGADIKNICISIFVLSISFVFGLQIHDFKKKINNVALLFFIISFIYGLVVYFQYLKGADMFSIIYAYSDKNSAAQIFLSACIIMFTLYKPSNRINKILLYCFIAILLYLMFILKSRATLLGFFFVVTYFTFAYENKKVRYVFFAGISLILLYILTSPTLYKTVVEGILFANRDASDLNSLSSGRVELLNSCIQLFLTNPFIGIGNKYFDCFPVIILTQYGMLGALIIFTFIGKVIKDCFCVLDKSNKLDLCAFLLMVTYLLDSLFEAQPPFGPGVKCFPLWMIWGIMLSNKVIMKKKVSF